MMCLICYIFVSCFDADWFWLVKWSCVSIVGGIWMAKRPEDRLPVSFETEDMNFLYT